MKAVFLIGLSALVAAGFASISIERFHMAADGYRSGNRLELIRSSIIGSLMSMFAAAAGYGALMRVISLVTAASKS